MLENVQVGAEERGCKVRFKKKIYSTHKMLIKKKIAFLVLIAVLVPSPLFNQEFKKIEDCLLLKPMVKQTYNTTSTENAEQLNSQWLTSHKHQKLHKMSKNT